MRASSHAKNLIMEFEGLSTVAYKCPSGVLTIGYGHTGRDVKPGDTITPEHALKVLDLDLARFEKGVFAVLKNKNITVNQNQFDALVSFAFNLGVENLNTSTLLKKLEAGDIQGAADQFLRWNKSGPELKVLPGLTRRREAERALFLSK